jgi:hypothetical protein
MRSGVQFRALPVAWAVALCAALIGFAGSALAQQDDAAGPLKEAPVDPGGVSATETEPLDGALEAPSDSPEDVGAEPSTDLPDEEPSADGDAPGAGEGDEDVAFDPGSAELAAEHVDEVLGDEPGAVELALVPLPPSSIDPPLSRERDDAPQASATDLVKVILALVLIVALAYVGGHPRVRRLEERLRISHVVTAGFPFIVLGLVARHPSVGILSDSILDEIRPILPFGLGWIGLAMGFRFDARDVDRPPTHVGQTFILVTALPFVLTFTVCGLLLYFSGGPGEPMHLRFALILAVASVLSGSSTPLLPRGNADAVAVDRTTRVIQLEQLAAVIGLSLVAAFFRPTGVIVAWQLPGMAWIFVTLGMSAVLAVIAYVTLAVVGSRAEVMLVVLGVISFSSGMASYLNIPATVVCFVVGFMLGNAPGSHKVQLRETLARLEGPIYLVFLFLAGAHWRLGAVEGWALLAAFVATRALGKQLGVAVLTWRTHDEVPLEERRALALSPMGALAIAIAVSAQDLFPGVESSWVMTAVIGGAIVNEVFVQAVSRGSSGRELMEEAR